MSRPAADPVTLPPPRASLAVALVFATLGVLLGLPLYNFGAPSSIKAWVDHVVAGGLSVDFERGEGLLGGRELIVLAARGGGYAPGSPRDGWDHAQLWLPHGLDVTGL